MPYPNHESKQPLSRNKTERRVKGDVWEENAKAFLLNQGLIFVEQNYLCKVGELDLVFKSPCQATYIFVEVRFRRSSHFGGAAASVTLKKQQKIKKAAIFYLQKRKLDSNIRFDVIAYENGQLNWIESAFS